jgi:hypothetical protein
LSNTTELKAKETEILVPPPPLEGDTLFEGRCKEITSVIIIFFPENIENY